MTPRNPRNPRTFRNDNCEPSSTDEHALRHSGCRKRHIATALKGMDVSMWRLTTASLHKQSKYRLLTSNNPPLLRPRATCYCNWHAGTKETQAQAWQRPSYATQQPTEQTQRATNSARSAQSVAGFSTHPFSEAKRSPKRYFITTELQPSKTTLRRQAMSKRAQARTSYTQTAEQRVWGVKV